MEIPKEQLLKDLSDAVLAMDEGKAAELSLRILGEGIDPCEAMEKGICHGMERVRRRFEEKEYAIPELLACGDAMRAALSVLEPRFAREPRPLDRPRVATASIFGDGSGVGRAVVQVLLESIGVDAVDLGSGLRAEGVAAAVDTGAQVLVLWASTSNATGEIKKAIDLLADARRRTGLRVVVGGIPISQEVADRVGADGYASDVAGMAIVAARLAREGSSPRAARGVCCGPATVSR